MEYLKIDYFSEYYRYQFKLNFFVKTLQFLIFVILSHQKQHSVSVIIKGSEEPLFQMIKEIQKLNQNQKAYHNSDNSTNEDINIASEEQIMIQMYGQFQKNTLVPSLQNLGQSLISQTYDKAEAEIDNICPQESINLQMPHDFSGIFDELRDQIIRKQPSSILLDSFVQLLQHLVEKRRQFYQGMMDQDESIAVILQLSIQKSANHNRIEELLNQFRVICEFKKSIENDPTRKQQQQTETISQQCNCEIF